MPIPDPEQHVRIARRYFGSFARDYQRAFEGRGRDPLHRVINLLFRRKTFQRRTAVVRRFLEEHGVAGKRVLDLGCGSGDVSLMAARLGARVTGLDLVEEMVALARRQAEQAGLGEAARFDVADATRARLEPADVTLIVSVLEYYADIEGFLLNACAATSELLVIVDTRGPLWRRALRHTLARLKRFRIYYRSPEEFAALVGRGGFVEKDRVRGHSFWAIAFRRAGAPA